MKLNRLSPSAKIALRQARLIMALLLALANLLAVPLVAADASPTIASDLPDYNPGQLVTLTGTGWAGDTTVTIVVTDAAPTVYHNTDQIQVQSDGTISDSFNLPTTFVDVYFVTATGAQTGRVATTTFTDANSSANLDQCANDPLPSPSTDGCSANASDWVNGNLGASKSVYFEGDSIPYRLTFGSLSTSGSHTVTIEWDTTKSSTHALDYLTTFNRTVATANPCLGVSGCNFPGLSNTDYTEFTIPADPQVTGAGVTPIAGKFRLYGGTITSVSAPTSVGNTSCSGLTLGNYCYSTGLGFTGDKSAAITIKFSASVANPVLAWGGHISTRQDWGANNSAVAISGSPYHTRLIDLDGSGGNQDRSLSADAVIFPGSITIVKDAIPNGSTSFPFTASPTPLSNFNLVDDGTSANTKTFSNITNFQSYTVAESTPSGWTLTGIVCSVTSPNGGSQTVTSPSVSIDLKEGENVTCTYTNSRDTGTLKLSKTLSGGPSGYTGPFTIHYDCGTGFIGDVSVAAGSFQTVSGIPTGTSCTVSEPTLPTPPTGYSFGTPTFSPQATVVITTKGATVEVTTNNTLTHDQGYLKITKSFDAKTSGFNGTFDIVYNCGAGDQTIHLAANTSTTVGPFDTGTSCTVSEPILPSAPTGWTFGTPSISGSPATIVKGDQAAAVEVTVTNTISRDQGYLKISKSFDPKSSGFNGTFAIIYNCGAGDQTVNLAAGGSTTVGPFDTGTSCTVSEPTLPSAPTGWTFGTPSVSGSPATIVKGDQVAAVEVTVTNTITRDTGSLELAKSLTGGPAGYTGPFTIHWDCGTFGSGDKTVSAGSSEIVSGIPTGTSCTVSEPALPTPPAGYTFGTPSFDPSATVTIADKDVTVTVTTNNTITRDTGSLELAKSLTGGPAGYTGPFTIHWDCGTFGSGDKTVSSGSSEIVSGIPTGTSCTVSETVPSAPTGYTFGTPSFDPSATVTITTKGATVTVTTNNTLTRDTGSLKISKVFDPKSSGFTGNFTIGYSCTDGTSDTVSVAAGGSQTIDGIPTGTECTVSEVTPTPPSGWTFGAPTLDPASGKVTITTKGATVEVTVTNTITRDTGSLKITKTVSNPDGASVPSSFTVNYDCGTGYTGQVSVAPGSPATVNDIPTGNTCTVTEVAPAAIPGYTWGTVTYTPASVTIDTKGGTFTITVGNSITRDRGSLTLVKKVVNDNGGTATVSAFGITTSAASLTFGSGVANGTTTTYTSQKITVVTGNYTLKENDVYGYTEGTWSCTGAAGTVVPTFNNGSVAVGKGEDVVCTITNNDQPGTIIIKKITKPANTGSFAFTTTGTGYNGFTIPGGGQNSQTLNAGLYTVAESTQLGWILTGIGQDPADPNNPMACSVTGSGGSTGTGNLNTMTASISLKNGDTVTCVFENTGQGVTRTQGFWATHSPLANAAWFGGTAFGHTFPGVANTAGIMNTTLCSKNIDTLGKLMGGFWSDVSKKSTGAKRTALDQARMQLLQQLLAAELNASAFGSVPSGGSGQFAVWEAAYCGTNQTAIQNAMQGAASFNNSGDSSTFTPGTSADSKNARAVANYLFWDTLP